MGVVVAHLAPPVSHDVNTGSSHLHDRRSYQYRYILDQPTLSTLQSQILYAHAACQYGRLCPTSAASQWPRRWPTQEVSSEGRALVFAAILG